MFYGERVMDIPDGLPKWSGLNNKSDLIEDSPKEVVQKYERERAKEKNKKRKQEQEDDDDDGNKK